MHSRPTACSFAMAILLVAITTATHADNWPRFRGPNGSGLAPDDTFPATWTDADYLWKIDLPGVGHSSPVGWGNRLFITTGNSDTGATLLHCLNASTGKQEWERSLSGKPYPMHSSNSYASTTPAVDRDRVYLTWAAGGKMHCAAFNHAGDPAWRTELGTFDEDHGFAASPIAVEGVVCTQVDQADRGFLAGIDALSGKLRWRAERPPGKTSYATPCTISLPDGTTAVISQSMTGGMQAIAVQSGQVQWQLADAFPDRCVSSPFVAHGMVLGVCGSGGGGKLLAGVDFSSTTVPPPEKLHLTKQIPYVSTPLVVGDRLLLWHDQGKVSLVDLSQDESHEVLWSKRVGGKFFGSPILAGDKIYCMSTDGRAVALASGNEFKLLGETDLGDSTYATPTVHQGRMYLRTESSLSCLPAIE